MFEVLKPTQKPITVIRPATSAELSDYEKRKLANIEENAQENKIELISLNIAGQSQRVDILNKEATIDLGTLAVKSSIEPSDIASDGFFIIKCELSDTDMC